MTDAKLPRVSIRYCVKCGWMLRAAWMAQEILTTFYEHISEVSLVPSTKVAGVFEITIEDKSIWERKRDGGFPAITELKQRVRDVVAPDKHLGHGDTKKKEETPGSGSSKPNTD
eukprot:TRINITY_DN7918_c0_g1_i1.p1 TRINITY_DN7918_c0_g1~~TRINITY_DN7918_c0_g1_i1.p1  ORF type:complete len:114 (-),score=25.90 TRINITY_DN7918_c0_g1_i1:49-390(-)